MVFKKHCPQYKIKPIRVSVGIRAAQPGSKVLQMMGKCVEIGK